MPIIVGSVRSGTTMFCTMLNAHPELAMGFESYFVAELWHQRDRWQSESGFDLDRFVTDLLDDRAAAKFRRRFALSPDLLRERLHGVAPIDYSDAVRRVYALLAEERGKTRYGEKTAGYVWGLASLSSIFPEAQFLHIVRDGRDAAVADAQAHCGAEDFAAGGRAWADRVGAIRRFGAGIGRDRYFECRYEDLVADPERILRAVCDRLDLAFRVEMLAPDDNIATLTNSKPDGHHHSSGLPPTAELRSWRRDVPERNIVRFEAEFGPVLSEFGYERAFPRIPLRTRATVRARHTKAAAGRGLQRVSRVVRKRAAAGG